MGVPTVGCGCAVGASDERHLGRNQLRAVLPECWLIAIPQLVASPSQKVAAFMALMECVRGERPGVFNNRLFHRAFDRMVSTWGQ